MSGKSVWWPRRLVTLAVSVAGLFGVVPMVPGEAQVAPAAGDAGDIETFAGTTQGYSGDGGPAEDTQLNRLINVEAALSGEVFIADAWNQVIRRVSRSGSSTRMRVRASPGTGRGRPPEIPDEIVEKIVSDTLHTHPDDGLTHWSTRTMAERFGVGKDTVARIWRARNIKPWLVDTFKLSNDPNFEEKLVDVVGLYLDPPERAVVLCVDEKSQCQALERSQPSLPIKPGRGGTLTHDYKRHGTTTLFAALDAATGEVLTDCKSRHRHQEFLGFLKLIDLHVPEDLEIHLVLDNYAAHKHENVTRWLENPARKDRFHLHFKPTSSSWLNLVERWFKELTDKRLTRDSFTSVDQLVEAIELWAEHWNDDPKPFVWHKTAADIIAKVRRGRAALTRVTTSATHH